VNMSETISKRISELMLENNLNGAQLATAIGVSFPAVCQWQNERSDISIENLFNLAKLFKCSIDYLTCKTEIETTFILRLQDLMRKNSVSLYSLNKKGILPKSTYYTWKKGATPRLSNIMPLADYFNCSVDYLLGCQF
ncbi:MAG: helix-turn-helix transcriptional regulator, partial [Clostridia bacterium]